MRLLFTTTAGLGHFHPLVPLALAAVRAGHSVAFACPQTLCATVARSGFPAFPMLDLDRLAADRTAVMERITRLPTAESNIGMVSDMFIGVYARHALPDLVALCRRWHPDVIVREEGEFAGAIAAEVLGLPHCAVQVAYASGIRAAIRHQRLDELRGAWGLAPDPGLATLATELYLSFDPPSLVDPTQEHRSTLHLRAEVFDESGAESVPSWVGQDHARPLIYVTLGSEAPKSPHIFPVVYEALLRGVQQHAGGVVMTIGRDRDPTVFGAQPAQVQIERYVPQSRLLPYCDLVVTHGGHNTVLAALQWGLPMVLVPLFADQFHNAARCTALAVGRQIAGGDVRASSVGETVRAVLSDARYRRNAQRVQAEMRALPGVEQGITRVERLVRDHAAGDWAA